jgi:hypothetical protein
MLEIALITLIGGTATIVAAVINRQGQIEAARIAAEAMRVNSQVGAVGEEEVRNQVSPLPPVGN